MMVRSYRDGSGAMLHQKGPRELSEQIRLDTLAARAWFAEQA